MMLLRIVRLDASDEFIFPRAAEAGEWAVPGTFLFEGLDAEKLNGKQKAALRAGFLGVASFGYATLVEAVEASESQMTEAASQLAAHFVSRLGAPDLDTALPAAREELALAASLANHPSGTIIALHRTLEADGALRERYRILNRKDRAEAPLSDVLHDQARAFSFFEIDEADAAVDLKSLAGGAGV